MADKEHHPLCVDLDGSYLLTDSLDETVFSLLSKRPWFLFLIVFWLLKGRAFMKAKLVVHGLGGAGLWPVNEEVQKIISAYGDRGLPVILVTAANEEIARTIVESHEGFSEWMASDEKLNLKGKRKAEALIERYGVEGFDYIGDSGADRHVWAVAKRSWKVTTSASSGIEEVEVISRPAPHIKDFLKLIRFHQWTKNLLLFVPAIAGNALMQAGVLQSLLYAFLLMGMLASGTYIINDLLDLTSDREHPRKRKRAMASGKVSIRFGCIAAALLIVSSLTFGYLFNPSFGHTLLVYFVVSLAYSMELKKRLLLDVFLLSGFYVWRMAMGGIVAGIVLSPWLLGLGLFIFISLALVKRYVELDTAIAEQPSSSSRRAYVPEDMPFIFNVGMGTGLLSALVLALYLTSEKALQLYENPAMLWIICPLLLFWVLRVWFKASRGQLDDDPVTFTIADKPTYLMGLLCIVCVILAHPR